MVDMKKVGGSLAASNAGSLSSGINKSMGFDPGSLEGMAVKGLTTAGLKAVNNLLFGGRKDPDVQFCFYVEISGIQTAKFAECSGIEWTIQTESFWEGGNNRNKRHLIGQGSFKPLVLKKGFFAGNSEFFQLVRDQQNPAMKPGRTNPAVVIMDEAGEEIGRFHFYNAICTRYQGPNFNARQSEIAFEEIELTYEWFDFQPGDKLTSLLNQAVSYGISKMG
jgi:phage tail-like protein